MGQKTSRIEELNEAAARGDLDFLITTYETTGLLPNVDGANAAAIEGRLDVVKWLATRHPAILPDGYGKNMTITVGQYHVIDWINSRPGILQPVPAPRF